MVRGFIPAGPRSGPKTCTPFPKALHTARSTARSPKTVTFSLVTTNAQPSYSPVVTAKIAAYSFPVAAIVGDRDSQPKREDTKDRQTCVADLRRQTSNGDCDSSF